MELMVAFFFDPGCCSAIALRLLLLLSTVTRGLSIFRNDIAAALSQGGCADYEDAIVLSSDVIVCRGRWTGHVRNGSKLCSGSFTICSWKHKWILSKIPWSKVIETPGCYAYDAAQDGNRCGPCRANINSDDLAGIGKHCPHISFGQSGCLRRGRVDASCCVDSIHNKACEFQENVITGVVCCRSDLKEFQSDSPKQIVRTVQMHRTTGEKIVIRCPLGSAATAGAGNQSVHWVKNSQTLTDQTNTQLALEMALPTDSGTYECSLNSRASSPLQSFNITVKPVRSEGCADGTSEGLHDSQDIAGCAGSWKGHVKRASQSLCAKGWRVCGPKDKPLFKTVHPRYWSEYGGCFAYNAAQTETKCRRCVNHYSMAALGKDCAVNEKSRTSVRMGRRCFDRRHIQVYPDKFIKNSGGGGCLYRKNHKITGVLCCKLKKNDGKTKKKQATTCNPPCENGGVCTHRGVCACPKGHHGHSCQLASESCNSKCLHSGKCMNGYCYCRYPYYGKFCQLKAELPLTTDDVPDRP